MKHARSDYDRIQDPSGKIPKDEPVFLLRGQDCIAPEIVDVWATKLERLGGDPKMVKSAKDQANAMREWQAKHGSKIPNLPDTFLQNYPKLEKDLGFDKNLVIVDRKDWEQAKEICHKKVF